LRCFLLACDLQVGVEETINQFIHATPADTVTCAFDDVQLDCHALLFQGIVEQLRLMHGYKRVLIAVDQEERR
jgi:hypothetical protein